MKNLVKKTFIALVLTAIVAISTFAQTDKFLITKDSVGQVKLGMTFGEAKKIWQDYTFIRLNEYSNSAPVAVMETNKILMIINTDQKEYSSEKIPLSDDARIQRVQVLDERYKTAAGVHPNMLVSEAEKIYGKVELIVRNSIGLTEQATFANQPKMDFQLANKQEYAGINYQRPSKLTGTINYETTQFTPSAYIERITISNQTNLMGDAKLKNPRLLFSKSGTTNVSQGNLVKSTAKRLNSPNNKPDLTFENTLVNGDEKVNYVIKAKKNYRLTVTIQTLGYLGEEGPIMYGIVTAPNGESDGQAGGKIYDSFTTEDGDYEIMIAQNNAKSNARNVRFKVLIELKPKIKMVYRD